MLESLKNLWADCGAKFCQINSKEAVSEVAGFSAEAEAARKTAVFCDFSFAGKFKYPEAEGMDFLDGVLAQNILKLRYGKVLDTFLARENGEIAAECFVGNIDDSLYLIAESVAGGDFLASKLLCDGAEDLSESHVLFNIDGPEAWKVASAIFGSEVLNMPYLSIEKYPFGGGEAVLARNGKTGEFGYQILAENGLAEALFKRVKAEVEAVGGVLGGVKSAFNSRLEGNFFNVYAEGAALKNPILLGLQWMADFDKPEFCGSEKIFADRALAKEFSLAGLEGGREFFAGEKIYLGDEEIGEVAACGYSKILGKHLALASFKRKYAYPNFEYSTSKGGESDVKTVAMPPIVPLSLQNGMDS